MIVDFKYNIGDIVFYVDINHLSRKAYVTEGKIQGFSIQNNKREGIIKGINFKGKSNIPFEYVSDNEEYIKQKVIEYNKNHLDELIND